MALEHRFSFSIPKESEDTFTQPLKGQPIVMSIFVKNPQNINKLGSVKLIDQNNKISVINLEKVRDDLYVTKPITFPDGKFKIVVDGLDKQSNSIVWVSPSKFQAIDTSKYS